jgi:hypothetical protein
MNNIKVSLFTNNLSIKLHEFLLFYGFYYSNNNDCYFKIYEMDNILNVNMILINFLEELKINPHKIEIELINYENNICKIDNFVENLLNIA